MLYAQIYHKSSPILIGDAEGGTDMKQETRKRWRTILASLLCFAMVITMVHGTNLKVYAESGQPTVTHYEATYVDDDGVTKDLTDGAVLKNGQQLSLGFDWEISNDDNIREFDIAIDLKNVNMQSRDRVPLRDSSGNVVGEFSVTDNVIHCKIDPSKIDQNRSDVTGHFDLNGFVDVDNKDDAASKDAMLKIGDVQTHVTVKYDLVDSSIDVQKNAGTLTVDPDTGELYVPYTVTLTGRNGKSTIKSILDSTAAQNSPLLGAYDIVYDNVTYTSMEELSDALAGKELYAGDVITITYKEKIDFGIYDTSKSWNKDNTFKVDYKKNTGGDGSNNNTCWGFNVSGAPSVNKSGSLNGNVITWTVTVDPGVMSWDDVTDVKDILGNYQDYTQVGFTLRKEDFVKNSSGRYEATYTTTVDDSVMDSVGAVNLKNEADITFTHDGKDYTYKGEGKVTKPAQNIDFLPDKTCEGYDSATGKITWNVDMYFPTVVTDVKLEDYLTNWSFSGTSYQDGEVYVDGTLVVSNYQVVAGNGIVSGVTYSTDYGVDPSVKNYGFSLKFTDTFIETVAGRTQDADHHVHVTYQTKVADTDMDGKLYGNKAKVTYKDPTTGGTTSSQEKEATYKTSNCLTKTAKADGGYKINYTLTMKTADMGQLEANKDIIFHDILPDGMSYVDGSASLKLKMDNGWEGDYYGIVPELNTTLSADGSTLDFSFNTGADGGDLTAPDNTLHMVDILKKYKQNGWTCNGMIFRVTYSLVVSDIETFIKTGGKDFKNSATVDYGGKQVGKGSTSTHLKPEKLVTKQGTYNVNTAPDIEYSVSVNPDGLDLLPRSDRIVGVDEYGSAMTVREDSIVVTNSKTGAVLTRDTDYSLTLSKGKMVFYLPDETPLTITYKAKVGLAAGNTLDETNAFNSFTLSGYSGDESKANSVVKSVVVNSSGYVDYGTGSITLYKYWTNGQDMVALDGATFSLYTYNATTKTETPYEPYQNITLQTDGTTLLKDLPLDRIFVLYETKAQNGYVQKTAPYYFVLTGKDKKELPEDIDVNQFKSGDTIYYENDKIPGTLEITKTITGVATRDLDAIKDKITFTIVNTVASPPEKTTVTLDQFTLEDGVYKYKMTNLQPGIYQVEEKVTADTEYTLKSATYRVNGGTPQDATRGSFNVKVESDQKTTAALTNNYQGIPVTAKFLKYDELTQPLSDATLGLYAVAEDGSLLRVSGWTSSATAHVEDNLIADQIYLLREENAPTGYKTAADIYFKVSRTGVISTSDRKDGDYQPLLNDTVTMVDEKDVVYTDVTVSKTDIQNNQIAGASLAVYPVDDAGQISATAVDSWNSVAGQNRTISGLIAGQIYVLKELSAPQGYTQADDIYFVVAEDGTVTTSDRWNGTYTAPASNQVVMIDGDKPGSITLEKTLLGVEASDLARVVQDITFTITNSAGVLVDSVTLDAFTLSSGVYRYTKTDLPTGVYTVTETVKTSEGYRSVEVSYTVGSSTTKADSATVTVSRDQDSVVSVINTLEKKTTAVTVEKHDTSDASLLAGASLAVYAVDSAGQPTVAVASWTSSAAPHQVTGLIPDTVYVLRELGAPAHYSKAADIYFKVTEDGKISTSTAWNGSFTPVVSSALVMDDEKLPSTLTLTKVLVGVESMDLDRVEQGITFTITAPDGSVTTKTLADMKTAAGEYIYVIDPAQEGKYTVQETVSVTGYTNSTQFTTGSASSVSGVNNVTVKVEPGDNRKITFTNTMTQIKKDVVVKKVDVDSDPVEGAKLAVYAVDSDGNKNGLISENTTGSNGLWTVSGLKTNTVYVLSELDAPAGYVEAKDIYFTVDEDGKVKTSADYRGTYKNEPSGQVVMTDLSDAGNLKLTKTLQGVAADDIERLADEITFTVVNEAAGFSRTVTLADFDLTKTPYEYDFGPVEPGTYTVTETVKTGTGYDSVSVAYTVGTTQNTADSVNAVVGVNQDVVVKCANTLKDIRQSVKISKVDLDGRSIDGAALAVNQVNADSTRTLIEKWNSVKGQNKKISGLIPDQIYELVELAAPQGYDVSDPIYFKVDRDGKVQYSYQMTENYLDAGADQTIQMTDKYTSWSVPVAKTNLGGALIEGATLAVYHVEADGTRGTILESWTTVAGTEKNLGNLTMDEIYVLVETQEPNGYKKAGNIYFKVDKYGTVSTSKTYDGTYSEPVDGRVTMVDRYATKGVDISKTNADGALISGASLAIYPVEGTVIQSTPVFTWTSQAGQTQHVTGLEVDQVYALVETSAPTGYKKADTIYFKMDADGKVTVSDRADGTYTAPADDQVTMVDEYQPHAISVSKTDLAGNAIENASLAVYLVNADGTRGAEVKNWTSSATSKETVDGLIPGQIYVLHELAAPSGYTVAADIYFQIDTNGEVYTSDTPNGMYSTVADQTVVMRDAYAPAQAKVAKVDGDMNKLAGAELAVYQVNHLGEQGAQVDSWMTQADQIHTVGNLTVDEVYKLVETKAPQNYQLAEPIFFKVDVNGQVTYSKQYEGPYSAASDATIFMVDQKLETPTPSPSPSATPTASPSATPTASPSATPTASPSATPTASPSATPTASPSATPTASPSATPTASPSATPTASPSATPTASPSATPTASPSATQTASPSATPAVTPSATPTASPGATPIASPGATPGASATPATTTDSNRDHDGDADGDSGDGKENGGGSRSDGDVDTGDHTPWLPMGILMFGSLTGLVITVSRKRKYNRN